MVTNKVCSYCGKTKDADEFYSTPTRHDGLNSWCKVCQNKYNRQRRSKENKLVKTTNTHKQCRKCYEIKPLIEFSINNKSPDGYHPSCKVCHRKHKWLFRYNLLEDQYEKMLKGQNGVCKICGQPETHKDNNGEIRLLVVDHDHKTNKIRGLLCTKCNLLLGNAKDDSEILEKAIKYLKENQ